MKHVGHIAEYIILFALNAIAFWYFRGYFNLILAGAMILFFLYAVISVHIVKRYVSAELTTPVEKISKKTSFFVKLHLTNRSFLPQVKCRVTLAVGNVFVEEMEKMTLTVPVKLHGTTVVDIPLVSNYAGSVQMIAEELALEDMLSFHTVKKKLESSVDVYVLPVGTGEESFSLNDYEVGMEEVEESRQTGSDFSEVSQIREYVPGDGMRDIHWKLSAKKGDWMVKERLRMSSKKLLVILSLQKNGGKSVDDTLERMAGFVSFFLRNRVPVTLFWWSGRYGEIRQETAEFIEEWEDVLVRVFHDRAGDGYVEQHFQTMYPGQGYVLITNEGITSKG